MDNEADLLERLCRGDVSAWTAVVNEYTRLVESVARHHRLSPADAADVAQATWLALFEHCASIRDGRCLPGWLRTTARNECLRLLRRSSRERPRDELGEKVPAISAAQPEQIAVGHDLCERVRAAVDDLPDTYRHLIATLLERPEASYAEVGGLLGLPVGSIGPMRGRGLRCLRRDPRLEAAMVA